MFLRTQLLVFPWPTFTYPSRVTVQKYWKIEFVLTGQCKPVFQKKKKKSYFLWKGLLLSITMIWHCLNFASSYSQYKWNVTHVFLLTLRGPSHLIIFPACGIKQSVVEWQSIVTILFCKASISNRLVVLLIDIYPWLPTSCYWYLQPKNCCPSCTFAKEILSST